MKITKSTFMEYVRCPRYAALNNLHKEKDLSINKERYYDLLRSLELEIDESELDDIDLVKTSSEHLEVMMPYFNEIELLLGKKVENYFRGKSLYSNVYGEQKLFTKKYKDNELLCYVDIYNESEKINIIEVKATTTNKFIGLGYTEKGADFSIFEKDKDNVLRLKEFSDPECLKNKKYMNARGKLFDRFDSVGAYVYDLAFQRFVIEDEIKGADYYLGVLNHEFVFDGQYADGQPFYGDNIGALIDLTAITELMQDQIRIDIDKVLGYIESDKLGRVMLGKYCQNKKMRECIYKKYCFDILPEKNNLLMYINNHCGFKDAAGVNHDRFDLIQDGKVGMLDIGEDMLTRENNIIQRGVVKAGKPYYNLKKIKDGIAKLKYPIYHLDFESFPCPLPRFEGEKPYTQSVFQFSLHVENAPGVCNKETDHCEFLADSHEDTREALMQKLCENIKDDDGSVLVYNKSFESSRLKELAVYYPAYADKLNNIISRLFDLMDIVKTNTKFYQAMGYSEAEAKELNFYNEDLAGSYSIKKVLPIFSHLTYKGMEVGNGMEAVYTYASFPKLNKALFDKKYTALLEYCKQDTWAMVEILDSLRKL